MAKAIFGQQAGAAGVIMVNNAAGFPPYEGPITGDPDAPGRRCSAASPTASRSRSSASGGRPSRRRGAALVAADGGTLTETAATIANPGFEALASFSSFGPATGDQRAQAEHHGSGREHLLRGHGHGHRSAERLRHLDGRPAVTGEAALVKQAHPNWRQVKYWVAAIENTADPSMVNGFSVRGAGTGFAQALPAVQTQVVALGDRDNGDLSFGFNELSHDFSDVGFIRLKNFGNSPATFSVTDALANGSPHTTAFPSSVTVWGHGGEAIVPVRLTVPSGRRAAL